MPRSPTARSLELLRSLGYIAQVVEQWIPQARRRRDLYGVIDVLAIRHGEILGVQATTENNRHARQHKIMDDAALSGEWLDAGGKLEVWAWKLRNGRWQCRRVEVQARENTHLLELLDNGWHIPGECERDAIEVQDQQSNT